jgi:uncharacterized membrane protein YhaH (DUF805 family)
MSFLGMGIPRPTPAWGLMVAEGRELIVTAWWLATLPGLAIILTVFSLVQMSGWLQGQLGSDSNWKDFPIFRGRYNRAKYLGTLLGVIALVTIGESVTPYWLFVAFVALWLISVKRLHDLDKSGWYCLLLFVPLVNILLGLMLLFKRGSQGANTYGADPRNMSILNV